MTRDPIVEEIHRIRDKLVEEAGGDPRKLRQIIRSRAAVERDRLVSCIEDSKKAKSPH